MIEIKAKMNISDSPILSVINRVCSGIWWEVVEVDPLNNNVSVLKTSVELTEEQKKEISEAFNAPFSVEFKTMDRI